MLTSLSHRPQARRAELFPTSPRLLDFHGVLFRESEGTFEPGSCVTADGVESFVIATVTKADEPGGMSAPFRIAIRAEGPVINAYLARMDSMADAMLIGCVARSACDGDRSIFNDFQALMQRVVSVASLAAFGEAPSHFEAQVAPEHEKAGHA